MKPIRTSRPTPGGYKPDRAVQKVDLTQVCRNCAKQFVITVAEQTSLEGFFPGRYEFPQRCLICREIARDVTYTCVACGSAFIWSSAEQLNFSETFGPLAKAPARCLSCRRRARTEMPGDTTGVVKLLAKPNATWGFLTTDDGRDIFFSARHLRGFKDSFVPGTRVRFHVVSEMRGSSAQGIEVI